MELATSRRAAKADSAPPRGAAWESESWVGTNKPTSKDQTQSQVRDAATIKKGIVYRFIHINVCHTGLVVTGLVVILKASST